jgi:hypothetical protein
VTVEVTVVVQLDDAWLAHESTRLGRAVPAVVVQLADILSRRAHDACLFVDGVERVHSSSASEPVTDACNAR